MSISADDRAKLIQLATAALAAEVTGSADPIAVDHEGLLGQKRGCFVTVTNNGRLRGCIGTFQPRQSLAETIIEMGAAAGQDPRFFSDPITSAELDEVDVEVSVLSPLAETDDPAALTVGEHGIFIICGGRSGCFLPEVATDMGWDAQQFLSYCCSEKAGLPADAWRDRQTQVFLFTSQKFSQ